MVAAVHQGGGSGDEVALTGSEKNDGAHQILGLLDAFHGPMHAPALEELLAVGRYRRASAGSLQALE
jgi:hypothetical protein